MKKLLILFILVGVSTTQVYAQCTAITSLSETFENETSGTAGVPSCWSSNSSNLFFNSSYGVGGGIALTYFPANDDTINIVLPEVSGIVTKRLSLQVSTSDASSGGPSDGRIILYQSSSSDPADASTNVVLTSIDLPSNAPYQSISFDLPLNLDASSQGSFLRLGLAGLGAANAVIAIDNVVIEESTVVDNLNESFTGIANTPTPNLPAGWQSIGDVAVFDEYLQLTTSSTDAIVVSPGIIELHKKILTFTGRTESSGGSATVEVFVKTEANTDLTGLNAVTSFNINGTATQNFTINFKDLDISPSDGNYIVFRLTQANTTGVAINRLDDFETIDEADFGIVSRYTFTNNSRSDDVGSSGTLFLVTNDFGTPPASGPDRFGVGNNALATGFKQYVRVSNPVIDITQDFTINEWFYIDQFGSEDGAALFDSRYRSDGSQGGGLVLLAMKDGTFNLNGLKSTGGFANVFSLNGQGKFRTEEWHMATVTRKSDTLYLYVDAQLIGKKEVSQVENGQIWSLGGQNNQRPLRGRLDDVAFYNRALSKETLNELFLRGGFNKNRNPVDLTLTASPISEDAPVGTVIGTFSTSDADEGDTHTYEIVGNTSNIPVEINGSELVVAGVLNAEGLNPYRLNVSTTDAGGLTFQKQVEFEILDVNEAPTDIAINSASSLGTVISTGENNIPGNEQNSFRRTLISIDEDTNDSHTYSITGPDSDIFDVTNDLLTINTILDYEIDSLYEFSITTTDAGGLAFTKDYTLKVLDNNDAPTDILLDGVSGTEIFVDELNAVDDSIATFITLDQDTADTHQYEFVNPATANIFTIDGSTLRTDIVFDFESTNSFTFSLRTLDPEFEQTTKEFTVVVENVNEAPTDLFFIGANPDFRALIDEGNAIGDSIAAIGVTDPDIGDTHTFTLSGNGAEDFTLDGNIIRAARVFDYNETSSYTINIEVTDAEGFTYSELFNVFINDVFQTGPNQETVFFSFTDGSLIDEINSIEATATEASGGNNPELLFPQPTTDRFESENDALLFGLNRSLAVFNQNNPLVDFNQSFSINFWFRMDGAVASGSNQILLASTGLFVGINEQEKLVIAGYANNNQVFNETINTPLEPMKWHMLTFVGNRENGNQSIDILLNKNTLTSISNSTLTNAEQWYFGSNSGQFEFYGKMDDITFFQKALSPTDVSNLYDIETNEAPTDIILSATDIDEELPVGTIIGQLTTTDPNQGDTHTYSLSGTDAASFTVEGNDLKSADVFDFETKSSYSIDIISTDQDGLSYTKTFTITINDAAENNAPTNITLTNTSVNENVSAPALVGSLSTTDEDENDTHTYTLSGTDASSFSIGIPANSETSQLALLTAEAFNFELKDSYQIAITTDDNRGGTFTKSFTIQINDVNEAATSIGLTDNTISENVAEGTYIGYFEINDPDLNDVQTVTLSGGDAAGFIVGIEFIEGPGNVPVLRSASVFDFESKDSYEIVATSTDQGGLSISDTFIINIEDQEPENSLPTAITLSSNTIAENEAIGTVIGTLSTTDPDENDAHTYSLSGENSGLFDIDGSTLITAEVFDFETQSSYEVTITTDDGNSGTFTQTFTIFVTDVDENETPLSVNEELEVRIYPNPVSRLLSIQIDDVIEGQIQLINFLGQIVIEQIINNSVQIDVSGLSKGIYVIRITGEQKKTEQRIIIK